ncbi:tRNA (adenosine(37)-N6)-threonylcarbamoyltransferase complex transferase subunit TsaD [bacterium]|nr:tRNA (adenosine(37)-N6)-threonylcarbamoyltransferase complex transferase subunit TsaD [bacterium]
MQDSIILGFDTSCDETSVAILKNGKEVLANVISSQIKQHAPFGGVVPELASRSHLENLDTVVDTALQKAGLKLSDITGIAVTASPGLIGCLLVGLSYAKSLAYTLGIPLTLVHHLKGHLFSPFLEFPEVFPFIGLVVSGGHTALYKVKDFETVESIGETVDDAAGEAYDKVAKLLNLGYPGGPVVDKLAQKGNDQKFKFTRARVKRGKNFFSFSGLKTQVLKVVMENNRKDVVSTNPSEDPFIVDLCASFQREVAETLVEKVAMVAQETGICNVLVSGGVAVNSRLRRNMTDLAQQQNLNIHLPKPINCTDNGAMIAYVGHHQLLKNSKTSLDANAYATRPLW